MADNHMGSPRWEIALGLLALASGGMALAFPEARKIGVALCLLSGITTCALYRHSLCRLPYFILRHRVHLPKTHFNIPPDTSLAVITVLLGFGIPLCFLVATFLPTWRDEKLPGFSFVTAISIQDAMKYSDKYVFHFSEREGANVSFYLSASDVFHFSIKDIRGETKNIDIPSGQDGIPLFRWISLLLEAGTASNYSV